LLTLISRAVAVTEALLLMLGATLAFEDPEGYAL